MDKARRYNKGKIRYELIPSNALKALAEVYTKGAHKYSVYKDSEGNEILGSKIPLEEVFKYELIDDGADNWRKGLSWSGALDSIRRHIEAFKQGEDFDPELDTYHLANAAWGLFTILEYYKIFPQGDDRVQWYKNPFKKVYLDLDGVVVDFETSFLEYFNLPDYSPTDWNDWRFRENIHLIKDNNDFWLSCKPLIKPEDIVYPITGYCTSRACSNEVILEWLKKNSFPICEIINVGFDKTKVDALKGKCDIFLDDSIRNFMDLNSEGIKTYLMTRPHNKKYEVGHLRVNNISEFFSIVC